MKKKLIAFILSLALLVSTPSLSMADDSISVLLNGEAISFEVQPYIEDGTTMVPFRALFEKLGFIVNWNDSTQTVTGSSNRLLLKLQIGSTIALVNDSPKQLAIAPSIKDGNTFVPLRFISEASGKEVKWDAQHNSVLIRDGLISYLKSTLYNTNGNLSYLGNEVNGQKDGRGSIYLDGKLIFEGEFKQNKMSGTGTLYWLGGQKLYVGQWSNDSMNGAGSIYNENGTLLYSDVTMVDNIIGGKGTYYLDSGWVYQGNLNNGIAYGDGKYYKPNGDLFYEGQLKNFQLDGLGKVYYDDGSLLYQGEFRNNMANGMGKSYNSAGVLVYEGMFEAGTANGQGTQYKVDGSIEFKGVFKNGFPVIDKAATQEIGINFSAEPPVLDSSIATANAAFTMINAFNEGLYRLDKDGKVQLGLAKDMPKITNNGLTYTITLRDAKWSDGTAVKSTDFVTAWKRTLDPATRAQYRFLLTWIKGGEAVTKAQSVDEVKRAQDALGLKSIDDKTLEINLERPISYFTSMLAFPTFFPQKADFVAAQGGKYGTDADKVIGTGPFKLVEWNHGQSLTFTKNENYWDAEHVKLNKFVVYIIKDSAIGLNLYESNRAEISELSADFLKLFQDKTDLVYKPELTTSYVMFQEEKVPAFANAKIRQALAMSINRELLIKTILNNGSVPSTGLIPNGTLDGNNQSFRKMAGNSVQPKFDPIKAKQLLTEGLQELGITSLQPFKLAADDTITGKLILNFIQEQWELNLGIDIIPEPIPHMNRVDKQYRHDFDAVVSLWGADYNDPMTFLDMWETGSEFNEVDWSNADYDALLNSARNEIDPEKRSKLLVDVEHLLMQEMPIGPLYYRNRVFLKKPILDGVFFPSFGVEWELKWASVSKE